MTHSPANSNQNKTMQSSENNFPYPNLNICDYQDLLNIQERFICGKCNSSRKFFCYKCSLSHPNFKNEIPKVKLPIKIDIIKHKLEVDGKSTSSHARMIANEDVNIYIYPDIPDYSQEKDEIVLIFPSSKSVSVSSLFKGISSFDYKENHGLDKSKCVGTFMKRNLSEVISDADREKLEKNEIEEVYTLENLPIKKAIFIDSTWRQSRSIYKDERINSIRTCIIQNRITKFWRTQVGAPKWYLSTIEAIHQFLLEFHISAWGMSKKYFDNCLNDLQLDGSFIDCKKILPDSHENAEQCRPYNGQYDNLLFFFSFLYSIIHSLDDKNGRLNIYRPEEVE